MILRLYEASSQYFGSFGIENLNITKLIDVGRWSHSIRKEMCKNRFIFFKW